MSRLVLALTQSGSVHRTTCQPSCQLALTRLQMDESAPTSNNSGVSISQGGSNFVRNESNRDLATVSGEPNWQQHWLPHPLLRRWKSCWCYLVRNGTGTLYGTADGQRAAFAVLADARTRTIVPFYWKHYRCIRSRLLSLMFTVLLHTSYRQLSHML